MAWVELKARLDAAGVTPVLAHDARRLINAPLKPNAQEQTAQVQVLRAIKDKLVEHAAGAEHAKTCKDPICRAWRTPP